MKVIAVLAFLALGGASFSVKAPEFSRVQKPSAVLLEFKDGSCSGTAVGPSLVLTAAHCFEEGSELKAVNGQAATVSKMIEDGKDHVLVRIAPPKCPACVMFDKWASFGGPMRQGQVIHLWGNPGGMHDIFRVGYVMGFVDGWVISDILIFNGDSGAGIFDKSGRIVGVVSTKWAMGETFHGMGAMPLSFTRQQLNEAGL